MPTSLMSIHREGGGGEKYNKLVNIPSGITKEKE